MNTLTRALHIHEIRVRRLHKSLELVSPGLCSGTGVEKIDGESLVKSRVGANLVNSRVQRSYITMRTIFYML